MKKILQINIVCGQGSTGKIALDIANYVNEKEYECHIAYGVGQAKYKHSYKIGNYFDLHFHSFISRIFCRQGYQSKYTTLKLVRYIKNIKPDIIHLHNIHGNYINYQILFKYLKKIDTPVVWTLHDCCMFTGKCSYFSDIGCDKWKTECNQCPQLNKYPPSKIDKVRKNFYDKKKWFLGLHNLSIICVSDWLTDITSQSFMGIYPIKRIYNGIDTEIFSPKKSNFKLENNLDDKLLILGVADSWTESKGLFKFIELAKNIDSSYQVVLVGVTEQQSMLLPSNIIGIKRTHNVEELVDLYNAADVFINFSTEETFGMVTAEAMSCGTPVIIFNSTASPELVNEDTGIVINKFEDVYEAINKITGNCSQLYGKYCRERVLSLFSKEKMVNEYLMYYNQLLEQKKRN